MVFLVCLFGFFYLFVLVLVFLVVFWGFFLHGVCMLTVTLESVEKFQSLRQRVVACKIRGSFTFNENRQTIQGERDY